jgi:glyceraldehyde 3-phosphate dehydrogenase
MKKIAINGFGRIGRAAFKIISDTPGLEVVAVNDLMSIENAAYLLKFDSIYSKYNKTVGVKDGNLFIDGRKILYYSKNDPASLPWQDLQIDIVLESTGRFTKHEDAERHINAGAKVVIISGPTESLLTPTVVYGVNTEDGRVPVFSCGSCTTNNIGPLIEIIGRRIGIKKAILNTVHSFTVSQSIVDGPSKRDLRMGRSAGNNLVPATTGAAVAITKALPQLEGKFDGIAIRTPTAIGSISDITFITERNTSVVEINAVLSEEAETKRYAQVLMVSNDPLVSSDIIKNPFAAIVDIEMTRVVDGDLVKIMAWYDNEWGFTNQVVRQIQSL